MCGIAGLIDPGLARDARTAMALAMARALAHRGPDGEGVWTDSDASAALSHRRLAVIDLTASGTQPMLSADRRWAMVYNGEIFNAADIRRNAALSGVMWRGTSDTEVILESVARRGLDHTLRDLNGMYALALWDRAERRLYLVRDRIGIKPLFYRAEPGSIYFASELKGLLAAGGNFAIDASSVTSFLRLGYVPAPYSILRDVRKVLPGEIVSVGPDGVANSRRYWSLPDIAAQALENPLDLEDSAAIELFDELLSDAVSRQMISDVPIGAFLSGGIDSSLIAALMVKSQRGPVRTFSIGFAEANFDESPHAAAVARHLGTLHTELIATPADALDVVPRLAQMYDEPFGDSSQIPTSLVSKLTRDHVTVALSGDGGDEVFAGYNRYRLTQMLGRGLGIWPRSLRHGVGALIKRIPDDVLEGAACLIPRSVRPPQFADKMKKVAEILPLDCALLYQRLISQYGDPGYLSSGAAEHPLVASANTDLGEGGSLRHMQLLDMLTYLPDDILQKVDRASMTVALEARPPFLDHRVIEMSWRLPRKFLIRNGETKWLLRRILNRYLPRDLVARPKSGFAVPLADWLRGPLREWAEDILDPAQLDSCHLNIVAVRSLWDAHMRGRRNWAYILWNVLMFETWRRHWAANLK